MPETAAFYLKLPKRTGEKAVKLNVFHLRTVVRVARKKELVEITCGEVGPALWEDYFRARMAEKGHDLDYATRRAENAALNAAVRMARCLFLARLLPAYASAGFLVPPLAQPGHHAAGAVVPPKKPMTPG